MAYSTTNLYPEDLNGNNPANIVTNEIHSLQVPGPKDKYFIIPYAAPYFVDSLEVYNAATGEKYVEGKDYLPGHRFIEAIDSLGRPVAGSIRFVNRDIAGQARLRYRTIGGNWGFSDTAILRELTNQRLNPLRRSWGDIDVLPYSFPPLGHDQPLDSIVGSTELNESLKEIASILEASAQGATQNHLLDFDNPHKVNAFQVGLGNVPNYLMANDVQSTDGIQSDLFISPRGVLLSIQENALKPLTQHLLDLDNPHETNAAQVGLGKVPNFSKATDVEAIDVLNDNTLMTPYTTALMYQAIGKDPRLDQLIIDFNNHLIADNPHHITPGMIGTFTRAEIIQLIAQGGSGGSDATTFGGETPAQWEDKFPANDDVNVMLTELGDTYQTLLADIGTVDMSNPIKPTDIQKKEAEKISWAFGGYSAYGIYNSVSDAHIVASSDQAGYPTTVIPSGPLLWASEKNANYFIEADGSIRAWGSDIVPIPTTYATGAGFVPANACDGIWAAKDIIYFHRKDNKFFSLKRNGTLTQELTTDTVLDMFTVNGHLDPRPMAIAETGTWADTYHKAFGDPSWVVAANAIIGSFPHGEIVDMRIGSEYLIIITNKAGIRSIYIYKINFGATITLTDVTNQIDIRNHRDGSLVKANLVKGVTMLAGSYTHFVFTLPRTPGGTEADLLSFGDDSQGQLSILPPSAPFLSIAAGYQFTITINMQNYVEFWGNSPDNSMIYRGGKYIPTEAMP